MEPEESGFAASRTLVVLESERTIIKTGKTSRETRYYLCSEEACRRKPPEWQEVIRGHWAGVENRNHWKRDAVLKEDASRSRKPGVLANLALLRNGLLRVLADQYPGQSLPPLIESLAQNPTACLRLLSSH